MDFSRKTRVQRSRIHEEETEAYYNFFLLLLIGPQLAFRQFVTDMYPGSWVQTVFSCCLRRKLSGFAAIGTSGKKRTTRHDRGFATQFSPLILLHEILLQFDWLRAVVFQLNLKHLHVKITNLLRVVV